MQIEKQRIINLLVVLRQNCLLEREQKEGVGMEGS